METKADRSGQLFVAMMRMQRAWQNITPCEGLSKAQFATLMVLQRGGRPMHAPVPKSPVPVTVGTLARTMNQSLPAMSQRITGLVEMGLVERVADQHDRRVSAVRLSEKGTRFLHETWRLLRRQMEQAFSTLQEDEFETLLRLMDRVADQLELLGTKNDGSV